MEAYKRYLYVCLMEECAEVIQNASKILRFGEQAVNPKDAGVSNIKALETELVDLNTIQTLLGFMPITSATKESKVEKYYAKFREESPLNAN